MPDREIISPQEILRDAHAERPVKEGTYLQRTGLRLACGVGALGSVVIIAVVVKWICCIPRLPAIPLDMDVEKARVMIENYKNLQQAAMQPLTTLLDTVVVRVLFPVFTSILGYIFASRESKARV